MEYSLIANSEEHSMNLRVKRRQLLLRVYFITISIITFLILSILYGGKFKIPILVILQIITVYCVVDMLSIGISFILNKYMKNSKVKIIYDINKLYIRILLHLIFIQLYGYLFKIKMVIINIDILFYLERSTFSLIVLCLLMSIKNSLLFLLKYRLNKKQYKDKIEHNENVYSQLMKVKTIEFTAINIFNKLNVGVSDKVGLQNFIALFDKWGEYIFSSFNPDDQEQITKKSFIKTFNSVLENRKEIKKNILNNSKCHTKLNRVFNVFFTPFISYLVFCCFGNGNIIAKYFDSAGNLLLAITFVFQQTLTEYIDCLIFIYMVRPYEIGDIIEFKGKIYKVEEIETMQTTLSHNLINHKISNLVLKKENIRLYTSNVEMLSITKYIPYIPSNIQMMNKEFTRFLSNNKSNFTGKFYIYNYTIDEGYMSIQIDVEARYTKYDIIEIARLKDKIELFTFSLAIC